MSIHAGRPLPALAIGVLPGCTSRRWIPSDPACPPGWHAAVSPAGRPCAREDKPGAAERVARQGQRDSAAAEGEFVTIFEFAVDSHTCRRRGPQLAADLLEDGRSQSARSRAARALRRAGTAHRRGERTLGRRPAGDLGVEPAWSALVGEHQPPQVSRVMAERANSRSDLRCGAVDSGVDEVRPSGSWQR
jgi:hypothetical protein